MIKFSLKCADGHNFDSWFQSAAAYDTLAARGLVSCAVCGDTNISKSMMAPRVNAGSDAPALRADPTPKEQSLSELRARIEAQSDYVGRDFARRAREIHEAGTPARPIHGEARPAEAKRLIEDGVPIVPLPFRPARKLN